MSQFAIVVLYSNEQVVSQFEIATRSRFRERGIFQWLMLDAVAALSH